MGVLFTNDSVVDGRRCYSFNGLTMWLQLDGMLFFVLFPESNSTLVIAISCGIAGLVFILAAIVISVVCCKYCGAGRRRMRSDSDTSSVTSSRQNLPAHLTPKYIASMQK